MVASLSGVVFGQIYPDNTGGPEFDSDLDGTASQEDEFVSITNTTGAPIDISGWQIWSDSTGSGAPDRPQDGLYHTFPAGSTLAPGETLYIINEITGTPPGWAQEASEGGVESGPGGQSTNLLTEGSTPNSDSEAIALVDPASGEYIVFNMAGRVRVDDLPGFPGTDEVGRVNAQSVQKDPGAGFSYQYDAATDSYIYAAAFVPCFARGTRIDTPEGPVRVEELCPGDLVLTRDHGPRPVAAVLSRELPLTADTMADHKPIEFKPGSLGPNQPAARLVVSPQHRMLLRTVEGRELLVPAKALVNMGGVRVMQGCRKITYVHLVFDRHEVVRAEGAWTESFFPGAYALSACDGATREEIFRIFPETRTGATPAPVRALVPVGKGRSMVAEKALSPVPAGL
ncbi:Hint domain-containing protein [Dinoroseobacter sp. PD6]|uniref:Hint domain-containing protein n=1 Tax=Dinoroseobacter sp. PD6 TaxID=3028384 RepID=UPI00237A31EC|nr:Hint domain-containing protein [Dinoroseobacter sp. PD6]MDD9715663.1 Hint domain-containing protein [Dinoroseobacter sp. PD6]